MAVGDGTRNEASASRSGPKPWGIRVLAAIYGILAAVTGVSGTSAALQWAEFGPAAALATIALLLFSVLTGLAGLGMWMHRPFGRMLALTSAWLAICGTIPGCCLSAWAGMHLLLGPQQMGDFVLVLVVVFGVIPLGAFILFSWFIAYLRQPHVRESFAEKAQP